MLSTVTTAAKRVAKPTMAQAKAGNYRMGHVRLHGLDVTIETPKGRRRRPEWPRMAAHYGYIKRSRGADGDHVDVFLGPNVKSELVVIIDQHDDRGRWDEHKVMLGFDSQKAAVAAYKACYTPGWKVGPVSAMTIDQFEAWLKDGDTRIPASMQVSKYAASESDLVTGKHGDKGRYVTTDDGAQIFLTKSGEINRTGKPIDGDRGRSSRTESQPRGQQDAGPTPNPPAKPKSFEQSVVDRIRQHEQAQQYDEPAGPDPKSHPLHHSQLPGPVQENLLHWSADANAAMRPVMTRAAGARMAGADEAEAKRQAFAKLDKQKISQLLDRLKRIIAEAEGQGVDPRPHIRHNNLIPRELAVKMKPTAMARDASPQERYAAIGQAAFDAFVERYRGDGRWITIGSDKDAPRGEKGGTPVFVDGGGEIQKGPKALEGQHVGRIKKPEQRPKISNRERSRLSQLESDYTSQMQIAENDEQRAEARKRYRDERNRIVGAKESAQMQFDARQRQAELQKIAEDYRAILQRPKHHRTKEEHAIATRKKQQEQIARDAKRFGPVMQEIADAWRQGDWSAVDQGVQKAEAMHGFKAMRQRAAETLGYRPSHRDMPEYLAEHSKPPESLYDWSGDFRMADEHEKAVQQVAEKDPSQVPGRVAQGYVHKEWGKPLQRSVDIQRTVESWENERNSEQWRRKARAGRKHRKLAKDAVGHYRKQLTSGEAPLQAEAKQEVDRIMEKMSETRGQWEKHFQAGEHSQVEALTEQLQQHRQQYDQAVERQRASDSQAVAQALGGGRSQVTARGIDDLPPQQQGDVRKAIQWLESIADQSVLPEAMTFRPMTAAEAKQSARSFANGTTVVLHESASVSTIIHEMGHAIEHGNGDRLGERSKEFLAAMTTGDPVKHGGDRYGTGEVMTQNGFADAYTGKYYGGKGSTEILSMGLQRLYESPKAFARSTPEHFDYTIAAVRGMIQ